MNNSEALARIREMEETIEKIKNQKLVFDANGEDVIFPEVEEGDQYGVGDKVELEGDSKPTFERVMPDGSTIIVKDGILNEIIEAVEEETAKAQKVFNCAITSNRIEIFGDNPAGPFMVGNKIKVNGNENLSMGRFSTGSFIVSVNRGKISAIKSIPSNRSLFKSSDSLDKKKDGKITVRQKQLKATKKRKL